MASLQFLKRSLVTFAKISSSISYSKPIPHPWSTEYSPNSFGLGKPYDVYCYHLFRSWCVKMEQVWESMPLAPGICAQPEKGYSRLLWPLAAFLIVKTTAFPAYTEHGNIGQKRRWLKVRKGKHDWRILNSFNVSQSSTTFCRSCSRVAMWGLEHIQYQVFPEILSTAQKVLCSNPWPGMVGQNPPTESSICQMSCPG